LVIALGFGVDSSQSFIEDSYSLSRTWSGQYMFATFLLTVIADIVRMLAAYFFGNNVDIVKNWF